MSLGKTSTLKTYGSRGAIARTKSLSDNTITGGAASDCSASDSRPLNGAKTSLSALKRKHSNTNNLDAFFSVSQPSKKPKLVGHTRKSNPKIHAGPENVADTPALAQLHFLSSKPILVTCKSCDLSYTRGAPEDESLHRAHCLRIVRGLEWSREERTLEKPLGSGSPDVEVVEERCVLPNGDVGRIVRIRCDVVKGKLGQKVTILLSTVNKALSAPPLPESSLNSSKAYVMIIPGSSSKMGTKNKPLAKRPNADRIVGCVITTHITTAMRVIDSSKLEMPGISKSDLVCVDIDDSRGNVYCDPKPIPATLGIPRLFVVPSHRRQGIAQALLNAAAKTAIWGCPLEPASGQIAFSQPTASGRAVMKAWGGRDIHIYDEQ
ncbi:unnamed protein product [Rhizoctonia solani]|uniref:N-acetyltransferase ECO1 n=3 Tax=Rhizoctonia solani TaxID=456999 RepID=A0A8H3CYK0_9AGAM|nr:GNAT family acetyltransferase [Rhizoctonia solani AG-3 Rhs1AP]KEP47266.1 GNAT family acetyltransferase [Rhizoctonia solani 123E]CAE6465935.1 unnamed protein product [Rhizoctonia solani]CAE6501764.1 unnamed protein product [Rhizoctonia solani]